MKTLTHIFIALMAVLIAGGCLAGCNSKSDKDKELVGEIVYHASPPFLRISAALP
jgi:uncharacterized lipoprotein NlpE involved in copper resistance